MNSLRSNYQASEPRRIECGRGIVVAYYPSFVTEKRKRIHWKRNE